MDQRQFSFILTDGPKLPKDPNLRTAIRKQAMKDVAAARRKRNAQRVNAANTLPTDTSDQDGMTAPDWSSDDTSATTISKSASPKEATPDSAQDLVVWTESMNTMADEDLERIFIEDMITSGLKTVSPVTPYEALRARYQVDIQDLSFLTSFQISKMTVLKLADPARLRSMLGMRHFSYLSFVPSRYGASPAITAAADCVLAKLSSRLDPTNSKLQANALTLYAKALSAIQKAVSTPADACSTDTLCAVSLLSLHELLDPGQLKAWQRHVAGTADLIRHRKSESFVSQYEKALLYAHLGPAITEALYDFTHCYLAAPEWHKLCLSLCEDTTWLTPQSRLAVRIRLNETYLPGLLVDTDAAYQDFSVFDLNASAKLVHRTKAAQDDLLRCLDDYKAHLVQTSLLEPPQCEITMRRELFGGAIEALCVIKRLMAALHESDRRRYEQEAQALALLLTNLQTSASTSVNDWLFTGHETGVSNMIAKAGSLWEEDCRGKSEAESRNLSMARWKAFIGAVRQWD